MASIKNRMYRLEQIYIRSTFLILALAIFTLLNCIGCNGQLNQEKNTQTKQNTTLGIEDTLKYTAEIIDTVKLNQYKNGKKDGFWRTFHENGQLKEEGSYKVGLKEGLHKQWEDNGIILLEGIYSKGKANGLMKWYHEKGHLAGEGNMEDDIRVGKWKICDVEENGFCIEAYFKNGKRDGIWKINHENASDKLWKEQTWKDDKIVSEKCWDENGIEIECE